MQKVSQHKKNKITSTKYKQLALAVECFKINPDLAQCFCFFNYLLRLDWVKQRCFLSSWADMRKQSVKISNSLRPKQLVSKCHQLGQICPNTPTVVHTCISPAFKVQNWSYLRPVGSHKCTEGIDSDVYNQDINNQVILADGLQTKR